MHSGVLYYSTRVDINCERANDLRAQNSLSRAQITSARAKPLAKDVLRSRSNLILALWGREPRQGGLSYDWPFLKRDI